MNNILLKLIKLIKPVAKVLSKSLTTTTNNSGNKGMFSDDAKIACFSPLDKHTDDKYSVTNFRSVSYAFSVFMKQL